MEHHLAVLFLNVFLVSNLGGGASMRIEITSSQFDEAMMPTNSFNLSCVPELTTVNCASEILALQVSKGAGKPIVTLQQETKISYNRPLNTNVKAEGRIDARVSQSHLSVVFSDVLREDSGLYWCAMVYLDQQGVLQQEVTSQNYTVGTHDVQDVVRLLTAKLASVEKVVQSQQRQLNAQDHVLEMEKLGNRTSDRLEQASSKIDALESAGKENSRLIKRLIDEAPQTTINSAFSAGYNSANKIYDGQTAVFGESIFDVGQDYDINTGIYTAPVKGIYVFHLFIRTDDIDDKVLLNILANGRIVASLRAVDETYSDQSSVTSVVSLKADEEVKVMVKLTRNNMNLIDHVDHFSVFSGYLLRPLD